MSSTINYARKPAPKGTPKNAPVEVRFFGDSDEIPRALVSPPWVWWEVPRDFHEVRLIGEAAEERCHRLSHGPGECEACRTTKQRVGGSR